MKDLLQLLKDKQLILDEQLQNLNQNFGHVAQHLFENYAKNVKKVILMQVVIAKKQSSLQWLFTTTLQRVMTLFEQS